MSVEPSLDPEKNPFDAREHVHDTVSDDECDAMRALKRDGRPVSDIAFMLERDEETVIKHVSRQCWHEEESDAF